MPTAINTNLTMFVMIDGLRPDALDRCDCPTLHGLIERGAATREASSVMPSITLPCHTSIFHSVPPTRHGITTNDWQPMARPLPGLMDVAKGAGKLCAAIYNWEPLRNLNQPLSLDAFYCRDTSYQPEGDDWVADAAIAHLTSYPTDFAFVYFGTVDTAGHRYQWMSDEYLRQAERVDQNFGRLLAALPDSIHVLTQADHGGHAQPRHRHGRRYDNSWIIAGPSTRRGHTIANHVSLLDTAPTLARIMGLTPHRDWEGRTVEEVFA